MSVTITKEQDVLNDYLAIVDKLRLAREQQGITQYELAKSAGLKQATVSAIESKKKRPSLMSVIRMSRALGEIIML